LVTVASTGFGNRGQRLLNFADSKSDVFERIGRCGNGAYAPIVFAALSGRRAAQAL
jgi:hypothetical protein